MTPTDTSAKDTESIVPIAGQETRYAQGYPNLLAEIKQRIRSAQYAALKTVNEGPVALAQVHRPLAERPMKTSDTSEKGLEAIIVASLVERDHDPRLNSAPQSSP